MKTNREHMKSYAWCPKCGNALTNSEHCYGEDGWYYLCDGCNKEFRLIEKDKEVTLNGRK